MKSKEIIKHIQSIYQKFEVPKNLQEHMIRAAAVGSILCDNWNGSVIRKEDVIAVLLIHDLGNIVKMDMDTQVGLAIMGNEAKRIAFWKNSKKKIIEKYGDDDHVVSEAMAKEIGASKRVQFLLANKVFHNNEYTVKVEDWELKIAAYSDQRIGPFGVLSLQERFKELKERYAKRENKNVNHPKIDIFITCAFEIEKQLFSHVFLTEDQIDDISIKKYIEEYATNNE